MAEGVTFTFEFVDKSSGSTQKVSGATGGGGSQSAPATFTDAANKAEENNSRATGASRPGRTDSPSVNALLDAIKQGKAAAHNPLEAIANASKTILGGSGSSAGSPVAQSLNQSSAAARNAAAQASLSASGITAPASAAVQASRNAAAAAASGSGSAVTLASIAAKAVPPLAIVAAMAGLSVTRMREASDQLANFSPDVAEARSRREIRQVQANFRSADRIGATVADYVDATSRLSNAIQGIKDRVVESAGGGVNATINLASLALQALNAANDSEIGKGVKMGLNPTWFIDQWIQEQIKKLAEAMDPVDALNQWFMERPLPGPAGWPDQQRRIDNFVRGAMPGMRI